MKKIYISLVCLFLALGSLQAEDSAFSLDLEFLLGTAITFEEHINFVSLAQGGDVFTIGQGIYSDSAIRTVNHFYMNSYETSYELWYHVKEIAESALNYTFQHPGQAGSSGKRGQEPLEQNRFQPVTTISWRDAIVWCNAFSEITGKTPSYTYEGEVLRDSNDAARVDLAACDFSANGYRLPSETEWEYAARKIKEKSGNMSFIDGATTSGPAWDFMAVSEAYEQSKAEAIENNTPGFQIGTANIATASSLLGPMSNPKSGQANSSGLYDMSGNVLEFCWDWYAEYNSIESEISLGTERVLRGGSWSEYASFIYAADRYAFNPGEAYNYMGFRFVTNEL